MFTLVVACVSEHNLLWNRWWFCLLQNPDDDCLFVRAAFGTHSVHVFIPDGLFHPPMSCLLGVSGHSVV